MAPPVKGTNVALVLMRLESVGLLHGGTTWSKTNKIKVSDKEFRYLSYLPLWWPELSMNTGKARTDGEDYGDEARDEHDTTTQQSDSTIPAGMARLVIEEINEDGESIESPSVPK